jgi:uncharacterized membrane protein YcaP (DUF421 family)
MAGMLRDLLIPGVPLIEKIIRPIAVYAFLVVIVRIAGRRQFAELTPLDLVIAMTLSNAVQSALIGDDNSITGGFIGGGVLVLVNYLALRVLFKHPRAEGVVEGQPVPLIEHGRPLTDNLKRELITMDDLLIACREQGAEQIEDVEKAILEADGHISVFVHQPTPEEEALAEIVQRLAAIEARLGGPAVGEASERAETPAPLMLSGKDDAAVEDGMRVGPVARRGR